MWLRVVAAAAVAASATVATIEALVGTDARGTITARQGQRFRDCPDCPEMIVIPAGRFTMGRKMAADGQDGFPHGAAISAPARDVVIERDFAAGIYPVTRDEYATFVRATGRSSREGCYVWDGSWLDDPTKSWRDPGFHQTPRDPVVCVSWEDAQAYVKWLNERVQAQRAVGRGRSERYRLLTWEEAEYAAGAGGTRSYHWGNEPGRAHANYGAERCRPCRPARRGRDRWLYTSPVGSFQPNAFGLYDTAGNVWQWTDSCWPAGFNCLYGAVRGGSWLSRPEYLRIGEYNVYDRLNRNTTTGFRVARTVRAGDES